MHYSLTDGRTFPVGNIFCIGRNYSEHARELGNAVEAEPVVFSKPTSALLFAGQAIELPAFSKEVHYEAELLVLIGTGGKQIAREKAMDHVAGYGIGLDLTARDVQTRLKEKGLPWLVGKGFDGSACVSSFIPAEALPRHDDIRFSLTLNGEVRQRGHTAQMVYAIPELIAYLSSRFTLQPGDIIYTGTPAGVAALKSGDSLQLDLAGMLEVAFQVA